MKYVHIAAVVLFLVMAAIQFNDPDPLYWVSVYTASAAVATAKFFDKGKVKYTSATYGLVLAGLLMSGPGAVDYLMAGDLQSITGSMSGDKSYVESAREFGGLLIVAIYFVFTDRKVGVFKTK